MIRTTRLLLLLAFVASLGAVVIFLETPEKTRFWLAAFTAGHTIIFGLCALAFLLIITDLVRNAQRGRLWHYLFAWIAAVAIGIATEIIQSFVGRDAELADVYRDALGAAVFLGTAMTFDRWLSWNFRFGRVARQIVRYIAPLLIVLIFLPAIKWGLSYLYRDYKLPIIGSFNSPVMRQFMRTSDCKLVIMDPPAEWPTVDGKVGRLTFYPTIYPGILFRELAPDWSEYSTLTFGIYSERTDTVMLQLRINDRHHNEKYTDRYNTTLHVKPGVNDIDIPLERVQHAPSSRLMDLTDMGTIVLFAYKPKDTFSLYVSDLRLR